ncbi:FMN-binding protein [Actinomadura bangladeshensis]|uniref:FMN-binding protein n=1 Tax=Actinomadura bangladeshensis TaxID=453573 RepID=A0A4R4P8K4_9ACTN|nr:FMN-binding protein [Actinomadura bangladeshensis]TDC18359.1 FMN-binding protein [Actinomadura bangladeshensis]
MRRATITTGTTIAGVILLLSLKPHHQAISVTRPVAPEPRAPGGGVTAATADGTYRGQSVDTRYGPVQVEITMSKGRLTAVRVLRAPSENGRDREIAAMALPRLTQEAVTAGSARIDAVSGATYTSEGYITSLQSALDRAHA